MARTTEAKVQGIIEHDSTISLTPFIDVANSMVTDHCTGSSYTAAKLELIERWLAAHFYAIRDPRAASETAGGVGASYQHQVKVGLQVTTYGQMALRLDSAGNLAALDKRSNDGRKKAASISWLGTGTGEGDDNTT